jgi:hypothetical protein
MLSTRRLAEPSAAPRAFQLRRPSDVKDVCLAAQSSTGFELAPVLPPPPVTLSSSSSVSGTEAVDADGAVTTGSKVSRVDVLVSGFMHCSSSREFQSPAGPIVALRGVAALWFFAQRSLGAQSRNTEVSSIAVRRVIRSRPLPTAL